MKSSFDKTAFVQKVRDLVTSREFSKVAEAITPYIRLRLYEEAFCDRILAVRTVTKADLQVEILDDSYYVVANVEQKTAHAVVANFIDRPIEDYIAGERYKIPIGLHKTRQRQKNIHELDAYDYDILADAADKDVNELGNLKDWKFILMMNRCVALSTKVHADVIDTALTGPVQIQKIHFNRLGAILNTGGRTGIPSEDRLQVSKFLLSRQQLDDLALLDSANFGDPLTGEMFEKGVVVKNVLGTEYIASIKERMFVESDAVAIVALAGTSSDDTLVVDGITFEITDAQNGTVSATEVYNAAVASEALAALGITATNPSAGVVRFVKKAVANERDRMFKASPITVAADGDLVATVSLGVDNYDVLWAFPEPQFLGELIRISGEDVETEMWKTNGEEIVNSVSREKFGMGIGNYNGVAKLRVQRARYAA